MTPEAFVSKWSAATTKERAAAQEHFIDLCKLFDEPTPNEADPSGDWYAFEKGVQKTGAGRGWADVWKRGHFGWEYKSKSGGRASTMSAALKQLQLYALALESPPLLVVSDIDTIEIHTAFQNAIQEVHVISLEDILVPEKRDVLRALFKDPERLKPSRTRDQVTEEAAGQFASLAHQLRQDGHDPQRTAHFLNKLLFCMFAEDVGVLKTGLFTEITEKGVTHPEHFNTFVSRLFQAMSTGGPFGTEIVYHFNGGLFSDEDTLPLTLEQIRSVRDLALMDWSHIEPAIFGTLFERGLDPEKRSQLGAHYTDTQSIMRLLEPTIIEPLMDEWEKRKKNIAHYLERMESVKTASAAKKNRNAAESELQHFLEKLRNFRVLDPACGSGNFLYLSLQSLKGLEHRANIEAEALGLLRQAPAVGPEVVRGIELNSYAAELAKVTIWIGEIQWMVSHGYSISTNPVLRPLNSIEQRDAIMSADGKEPSWPAADVIVGNPPFLGDKKMRRELGDDYVTSLRSIYKDSVPGGADLVTYWLHKSHKQLSLGKAERAGLVTTNSIRGGKNRKVLDSIVSNSNIFEAWPDLPWINDGADVRVSLICFMTGKVDRCKLEDKPVTKIFSDLTAKTEEKAEADLTQARKLSQNLGVSFIGIQKNGPFDIDEELARSWLETPNPHGKPNSNVLKPWINGRDITRRPQGKWIIDFGGDTELKDAALYELPFKHVEENVRPTREGNRDPRAGTMWWLHKRSNQDLRNALTALDRYIATPRVAKHRLFVWMNNSVVPDSATVAIARSDDVTLGILHSRFHELWTLRLCTWLGVGNDPRYTPTSTFETFPFPDGLTVDLSPGEYSNPKREQISFASKTLCELRNAWLNPPEWIESMPEEVDGYPDRIVPKKGREADLKKRTLTNLYNERPSWLRNAHLELEEAVASAYGWPSDISDSEILSRLLDLNLTRLAIEASPQD